MEIQLPAKIYADSTVELSEDKHVFTFIGPNGSGKSKLLDDLKERQLQGDKVKLATNLIQWMIDVPEGRDTGSKEYPSGNHCKGTIQLIHNNSIIRHLVFHYFEQLFSKQIIHDTEKDSYQIKEGDYQYSIKQDGDGFKVFFNLLYPILSEDYDYILFDEPDRFFHPTMQKTWLSLITKLAKSYNKKIIMTTHSEFLVNLDNKAHEVFYLSKNKLSAYNVSDIYNQSTDDKTKWWLNYNRRALFCDQVVLTEGHTDELLLESLKGKCANEINGQNIEFISVGIYDEDGGKSNIPKRKKLLNGFMDCWAVFDADILYNKSRALERLLQDNQQLLAEAKKSKEIAKKSEGYSTEEEIEFPKDSQYFDEVIQKLLEQENVIVLQRGEMENYCQTLPNKGSKLKDHVGKELGQLTSLSADGAKSQYADLIKEVFRPILDNDSPTSPMIELCNKIIWTYFKDDKGEIDQYKYHVAEYEKRQNSRKFIFNFLPEKEFIIESSDFPDCVKERIEQILLQ
jgi:ABC-type multidrug transport system ATPase subunit